MAGSSTADGRFPFDLSDPAAYLEAERLRTEDPTVEWIPVLAPPAYRDAGELAAVRADVELRAMAAGLQPVRWPDPVPVSLRPRDARRDLRQADRPRRRLLARRVPPAYAGGRVLDDDGILIAGAACEMHPRAILKALETRSVHEALERGDGGRIDHRTVVA